MKISKVDLKNIVAQRLTSLIEEGFKAKDVHKQITESQLKEVVVERLTKLINESRPMMRDMRTGKVSKWLGPKRWGLDAADEILFIAELGEELGEAQSWDFSLTNEDHKKAKYAQEHYNYVILGDESTGITGSGKYGGKIRKPNKILSRRDDD